MKVIKNSAGVRFNRPTWIAISSDGRILSDGYPKTTPAAARRAGEQAVAIESVRKINGDSAAIKWILESM